MKPMKKTLLILFAAILSASAAFGQFGDSKKTGADYLTYSNRLKTVKLTDAEALNLITTIHATIDAGEIRRADIDAAMVSVFGEERAAEYLRLFDAKAGRGQRWSRRENVRMIAAMYPHIPGETEDAKAGWAISRAAPCFTAERWNNEVFPYVLERVQEYKDAGGTLDRWPEVIVKPAETNAAETDIPEGTKWLHHDVSAWPVTAKLDASVAGGTINMPYSKAKEWPAVDGVNANPWVIVNREGQWYAATFEWLRHGQTSKPVGVLDGSKGDHIKVSPLNEWRPKSGERIGLMVSGLARAQSRNVRERSNVCWVDWP